MNKENVVVSKEDGVVTVKVAGNFDSTLTPVLNKHCERIAGDKEIKSIVLDFERVDKIDTSAFACVIGFMHDHFKDGIEVSLKNLKGTHKSYIEMLKLSKFIKII